MPIYQFRNTDTGEEFEALHRMSELDGYLKENPHIKNIIGAPPTVDGFRLNVGQKTAKVDEGFKDVLRKIKREHGRTTNIEV